MYWFYNKGFFFLSVNNFNNRNITSINSIKSLKSMVVSKYCIAEVLEKSFIDILYSFSRNWKENLEKRQKMELLMQ